MHGGCFGRWWCRCVCLKVVVVKSGEVLYTWCHVCVNGSAWWCSFCMHGGG